MCNIIIFGGTTEGRLLSEYAVEQKLHVYVSVTTDYGVRLLPNSEYLHILNAKMDQECMQDFFQSQNIRMVIDATHPYAQEVTKNIRDITKKLGIQCYRVVREEDSNKLNGNKLNNNPNMIWFEKLEDIMDYLNKYDGDVFVTTGSKEIKRISQIKNATKRCVLRILDVEKIVNECIESGFDSKRIIAKRGPFSYDENISDFSKYKCQYLLTKDSGNAGGFKDKIEAAKALNMKALILKRPDEEGIALQKMMEILKNSKMEINKEIKKEENKKINIIGIGMDGKDTLTIKGSALIADAELIIGAKRMIQLVSEMIDINASEAENKIADATKTDNVIKTANAAKTANAIKTDNTRKTEYIPDAEKEVLISYDTDKIVDYIKKTDKQKIAVLMSGDCGFYSGCKKLMEKLQDMEVRVVSGISSAVYFAGATGQSWEDMNFVSLHGVRANIVSEVKSHKKTFFLLGGEMGAGDVCKKLVEYHYGDVWVSIGENLGSKEEKIINGTARELTDISVGKLSVMLVNNDAPIENACFGINDELWIRGKVPMTKSEVRAATMSKLRVGKSDICWDVGCGTGSVAVEMAGFSVKGTVYAIDKKHEAIELTKKNAVKFGCDNIITIEREIGDGLEDLPAPDVVFIGGSGGNMDMIVKTVLEKNSKCRMVMTAVSIETLSLANEIMKKYDLKYEVTQVSVARTKLVGAHTMFAAENPIFLINT